MPQCSSLPDRWRSHVARSGLLQRPELTDDGLLLGARTVLAASFSHPDEAPAHDRLVALLAAAYGGRVDAAAPPRIAKALAVWRSGDRALAACHLALARLPPIGPDGAYRLFLAGLALDEGLAPSILLREIGATEAARLLKFNPLEPRIPAGNGRVSGDWTDGSGGGTPNQGATVQPVANTTTNFSYACKKLGLDEKEASTALHMAKKKADLGGAAQCTFHLLTGTSSSTENTSEISETEMPKKHVETYDMSLRLWSDDVPMKPIVQDLGVDVTHLYERGQTIINPKARSRRIANRHYASLAQTETSNEADIPAWLDDTLRRLDGHPSLPALIQSGRVEALLWIATLGGDRALPPPPVQVDPARVAAATRLGARIFLEDYHRFDDGGVPVKRWLN